MSAGRELTMSEALNEALTLEMERDPRVFVIGEDIAAIGGLFQVTAGLLDKFGPGRVIDAPISEAGQAGAAVGAALVGSRPVVELQIADFVSLTMDQVSNHAAKWRYMSGGKVTVPFVLRAPVSSGIGMAGQHSQTLEAWFVHTPGLVVIMPSTPADAKGLLTSAIRDDNPVVFLEKRLLYSRRGRRARGRVHRSHRRGRRQARGDGCHSRLLRAGRSARAAGRQAVRGAWASSSRSSTCAR